jgi:pimeloyl-ACP methyl ester carboxylesterase
VTSTLAPTDPPNRLLDTAVGAVSVAEEGRLEAPAILCSHGIPGSVRDFRYLGPLLAEHWHVVRLDLPGFGGSPGAPGTTVTDWAAALGAVADALNLERPALLAHSFSGGAVILAAAARQKRYRGIALLASLGVSTHRAMRFPPKVYRRLVPVARQPVLGAGLTIALRGVYRSIGLPPPASRSEVLLHLGLIGSVDFDLLAAAARSLQLPVLAVSARDDHLRQPSIQDELAAVFPDAERLVFGSGGHHLQKTRANEVAAAVTRRLLQPIVTVP